MRDHIFDDLTHVSFHKDKAVSTPSKRPSNLHSLKGLTLPKSYNVHSNRFNPGI